MNDLDDIGWRISKVRQLSKTTRDESSLGNLLYGQSQADVKISEAERCPMTLVLSSSEDFATYCALKGDTDEAIQVIEV